MHTLYFAKTLRDSWRTVESLLMRHGSIVESRCPEQVKVDYPQCLAGVAGCSTDAACGKQLCCEDINCGYKICMEPIKTYFPSEQGPTESNVS